MGEQLVCRDRRTVGADGLSGLQRGSFDSQAQRADHRVTKSCGKGGVDAERENSERRCPPPRMERIARDLTGGTG